MKMIEETGIKEKQNQSFTMPDVETELQLNA